MNTPKPMNASHFKQLGDIIMNFPKYIIATDFPQTKKISDFSSFKFIKELTVFTSNSNVMYLFFQHIKSFTYYIMFYWITDKEIFAFLPWTFTYNQQTINDVLIQSVVSSNSNCEEDESQLAFILSEYYVGVIKINHAIHSVMPSLQIKLSSMSSNEIEKLSFSLNSHEYILLLKDQRIGFVSSQINDRVNSVLYLNEYSCVDKEIVDFCWIDNSKRGSTPELIMMILLDINGGLYSVRPVHNKPTTTNNNGISWKEDSMNIHNNSFSKLDTIQKAPNNTNAIKYEIIKIKNRSALMFTERKNNKHYLKVFQIGNLLPLHLITLSQEGEVDFIVIISDAEGKDSKFYILKKLKWEINITESTNICLYSDWKHDKIGLCIDFNVFAIEHPYWNALNCPQRLKEFVNCKLNAFQVVRRQYHNHELNKSYYILKEIVGEHLVIIGEEHKKISIVSLTLEKPKPEIRKPAKEHREDNQYERKIINEMVSKDKENRKEFDTLKIEFAIIKELIRKSGALPTEWNDVFNSSTTGKTEEEITNQINYETAIVDNYFKNKITEYTNILTKFQEFEQKLFSYLQRTFSLPYNDFKNSWQELPVKVKYNNDKIKNEIHSVTQRWNKLNILINKKKENELLSQWKQWECQEDVKEIKKQNMIIQEIKHPEEIKVEFNEYNNKSWGVWNERQAKALKDMLKRINEQIKKIQKMGVMHK